MRWLGLIEHYREYLPVSEKTPVITLYEGHTPLIPAEFLDKLTGLQVFLKYEGKKPFIAGLKRISKPGLRIYTTGTAIPRVLSGLGTAVISTSKGVIDDKEARKLKVGGEVLCYIW